MNKAILLLLTLTIINITTTNAQTDPPKAKRIDTLKILHNDTTHDYYHWMRNKTNPEFINYLYAENGYAKQKMKDTWLLQKHLYDEQISKIDKNENLDSLLIKGYWYYTKQKKGKEYPILSRKKDTTNAKEHIILDPNKLARQYGFINYPVYEISPNQKYLSYLITKNGKEYGDIFIKELDTDSILQDTIHFAEDFFWKNDSCIFYTTPKTKNSNEKIFIHSIGNTSNTDTLLWKEKTRKFSSSIYRTGNYLVINRSNFNSNEVYISDTNKIKFKLFQKNTPNLLYEITHFKNDSIFYITYTYKNKTKLVYCDTNNTSIENWKPIISLPDSLQLLNVFIYRKHLVYTVRHNGLNKIIIKNRITGKEKTIKPKGENYELSLSRYFGRDSLKFGYYYTSLIHPYEQHIYYLDTQKDSILKKNKLNTKYNENNFETKRLWAKSNDGTLVPIDIVYKKGLKLNHNNPTILYAYASYGINKYPEFSTGIMKFVKRGFVYAIAHPRGESFLGNEWYENGKLLHKKNTYNDFIACAKLLIDSGYTSNKKLAIMGGSAGGMLVTTAVNMNPGLFKCVVAEVPFCDVINQMQDTLWPSIISHFQEIGNPFKKQEYFYMKSWDPYQNIKDTIYPDILVTSGYNDSRVPVWVPAKWVAKLRYHKKDTNMLLLKVNMNAGHSGGQGFRAVNENSFISAFIMKSLGVKENYITIKGKVTDENGSPLPFVNIYFKGTSKGTTSNFDGEFSIDLQQDSLQTLIFQYVGFKKEEVKINMKTRTYDLNVVMKTEATMLSQVTVTANGKDPAYGIIKQAQKHRKKHLHQIKNMTVDVYIKQEERLNVVPEKLPLFLKNAELPDSNDIGLIGLSESVIKFYKQVPDKSKEIMIASKVAGSKNSYSWSSVYEILLNFYKNNMDAGFTERGVISPIASSAMIYYKYKLVDIANYYGKTVYKIKVIPRRKNDPVFSGYIYIVDDDWSIYATDLMVGKNNGIKFMDSLRIRQNYIPVNDTTWLLFTTENTIYFSILGIGIHSTTIGSLSNYNLNPKFDKKFFGYETYHINIDANKKDTAYWDTTRIIKLTNEEVKYYKRADSVMAKYSDPAYIDSIQKNINNYRFPDGLLSEFSYLSYKNAYNLSISPLLGIENIYYNTVEGLVFQMNAKVSVYDKKYMEGLFPYNWVTRSKFTLNPKYSITNNEFYGFVEYTGSNNNFNLKAGQDVKNYTNIDNVVNALYILFWKENFGKMYRSNFITASKTKKLMRGLETQIKMNYERRYPMSNNAYFSFYDYTKLDEKEFTSNNPLNPYNDAPSFKTHDFFRIDISAKIRFKEKYATYVWAGKEVKYYFSASKIPTIFLNYSRGFYTSDSRSGFDYLQISFSDKLNFKLLGESFYNFETGAFLSGQDEMEFIDYKHFRANQTIFLRNDPYSKNGVPFNSMNFFDYSSNGIFVSGSFEHHFNGWVVNKFPLFRKTRIQTLAGISSLYTSDKGVFTEIFAGIENILGLLRVDAVANYQNEKLSPLFRIGVDYSFQ